MVMACNELNLVLPARWKEWWFIVFMLKLIMMILKKNNLLTVLHIKPRGTLIFSNAFDCYCPLDIL